MPSYHYKMMKVSAKRTLNMNTNNSERELLIDRSNSFINYLKAHKIYVSSSYLKGNGNATKDCNMSFDIIGDVSKILPMEKIIVETDPYKNGHPEMLRIKVQ